MTIQEELREAFEEYIDAEWDYGNGDLPDPDALVAIVEDKVGAVQEKLFRDLTHTKDELRWAIAKIEKLTEIINRYPSEQSQRDE